MSSSETKLRRQKLENREEEMSAYGFSFNLQKEKKQRELLCFLFKQFKRSLKPLSFYRYKLYKHIMCVYTLWFHRKWKSLFVWGRGERDVALHDFKVIIVKDTDLLYFDLFAGVQSRFCPASDDNYTCYYRLVKSLLPFMWYYVFICCLLKINTGEDLRCISP